MLDVGVLFAVWLGITTLVVGAAALLMWDIAKHADRDVSVRRGSEWGER